MIIRSRRSPLPAADHPCKLPPPMKTLPLLFLLLLTTGCATFIYPPRAPKNPTTVYLCDYGVHSSLLLPTGDGQFVEYVYGDWDYAVLNKTDPYHTLKALFLSFDPALGRRFLKPAPGNDRPDPPNDPITIDPIILDADRVKAQIDHLNQRYQKHIETAHLNEYPNYFFTFVKDDERYDVLHNCNTLTVENLSEMGCQTSGLPILSNIIVKPPVPPK
jgi:hypothetical protein